MPSGVLQFFRREHPHYTTPTASGTMGFNDFIGDTAKPLKDTKPKGQRPMVASAKSSAQTLETLARDNQEAKEILEKLHSVFRPSEGYRWIDTPLDIFEGERPIDLIRRGKGYRVMQMLVRIEEGIHV